MDGHVTKSACISACQKYRYALTRWWDGSLPVVAFIGLNPSTADGSVDDQTIRRCTAYANAWGYGSLVMLNLFALRATNPKELKKAQDPVGPRNDYFICSRCRDADKIIVCWGTLGDYLCRDKAILSSIPGLKTYCLKQTVKGFPSHPLYLRKDLAPFLYKTST